MSNVDEVFVLPSGNEVTGDAASAAEQWADYARKLERIAKALGAGVGAFQAGHEAPWTAECVDDGGEVEDEEDRVRHWNIEDGAGSYVMEADDDDMFHHSFANAGDFLQAICDEVNLAANVADALAVPLDGVKVSYEGVLKADKVIRKAESDEADTNKGTERGQDSGRADGQVD